MSLSGQQDIITGDELLSDSYNLKEIDGAVFEADCKKISIGGENIGMSVEPKHSNRRGLTNELLRHWRQPFSRRSR